MTESEARGMVAQFRSAWPDETLSDEDAREVAKLFRAYDRPSVTQAIVDRVEADLPMPGRVELSRVLRAYAPGTASDPQPKQEPRRPRPPDVSTLEPFPDVDPNQSERIAAIKASISDGYIVAPREAPYDPEMRVVPPEVRAALGRWRRNG